MELKIAQSQRGRNLELVCSMIVYADTKTTCQSPTFDVGQMATVYFAFTQIDKSTVTVTVSVKRHEALKHQNVEVTVACSDNIFRLNCTDEWTQHGFIENQQSNFQCRFVNLYVIRINIISYIIDRPVFKQLYDDDDFTDFTIAADESSNSSIRMHKSVLAATSEVFKTKLKEEWNEKDKGCLGVKGVTQLTLEQFKKYMYYGELPEHKDLRPLLLIAKCYKIGPLEMASIDKLADTVKGEKLMDMLEFAVDNHLVELIFTMLQLTPNVVVDTASKAKYRKENEKVEKIENKN